MVILTQSASFMSRVLAAVVLDALLLIAIEPHLEPFFVGLFSLSEWTRARTTLAARRHRRDAHQDALLVTFLTVFIGSCIYIVPGRLADVVQHNTSACRGRS